MNIVRIIAAACLAASITPAIAQGQHTGAYTALTIGKASGEDGGTSGAIGFYGPHFGFEVGMIGNSEFAEGDALDYPVPHNYYTSLGTKRVGNTFGIDGLFFLGNSNSWHPFVGIGVYFGEKAEIARSDVTGWLYTQSSKSKTEVAGSVGLHYTVGAMMLGVSYHTVRGPGASIGVKF